MARSSGFLTRGIARWRLYANEPGIDTKYSDDDIIEMLQESYVSVLGEVNRAIGMGRTGFTPVRTYADIELGDQDSNQWYPLPPYVGKVLLVEELNSESEQVGELWARGELHPFGKGWRIEENLLYVQENHLEEGHFVRVHFAPDGCAAMHEGTAAAVAADGSTVTLASSPTKGELDLHPNAYAGSMLRILSAGTNDYLQERHIRSSSTAAAPVCTLVEPLSPIPSGAVTYEICPVTNQVLDSTIVLEAVLDVLAVEDEPRRYNLMKDRLRNKKRDLRLFYAQRDAQSGGKMERGRSKFR